MGGGGEGGRGGEGGCLRRGRRGGGWIGLCAGRILRI